MKRFSFLICTGLIASTLVGCASTHGNVKREITPKAFATSHSEEQYDGADQSADTADPLTCLYGTWLADNAFFLERIQEFGDEVQAVSGQVYLRFDPDGTSATEYQNWTISAVTEGMEVQIIRAGVDTGTYSVSEDTFQLNETDMASTLTVRRGSLEMSIDPHPAMYDGADYSCDENAATIETSDGALLLTR